MRPAGLVADRIADSIETSASASGSARKLVFIISSSLLDFFRAFSFFNGSRKNRGRGAARGDAQRPSRRNFSGGRDISTRGGKILTRSGCPLPCRGMFQNASVNRGYSTVGNGSLGQRSSNNLTF